MVCDESVDWAAQHISKFHFVAVEHLFEFVFEVKSDRSDEMDWHFFVVFVLFDEQFNKIFHACINDLFAELSTEDKMIIFM